MGTCIVVYIGIRCLTDAVIACCKWHYIEWCGKGNTQGSFIILQCSPLFFQKLAKLQISLSGILDEQKSGEKFKTHGDILAMHMLKETQSLEKFTRLITEQYDTHCADYKCLQKFHGVITVCTLLIYYCH